MCKDCMCENEMQCSVKGYQPIGWCCKYCDYYSSELICKLKITQLNNIQEIKGYCLGCLKSEVSLKWIYKNTQKGFCETCITKHDKTKLLDLIIVASETPVEKG